MCINERGACERTRGYKYLTAFYERTSRGTCNPQSGLILAASAGSTDLRVIRTRDSFPRRGLQFRLQSSRKNGRDEDSRRFSAGTTRGRVIFAGIFLGI